MQGFVKTIKPADTHTVNTNSTTHSLERRLLRFSLFNFFVVTVSGLLLRGIQLTGDTSLSFNNILHAHSHFAFGGWITPVLVWMIMTTFTELTQRTGYTHWRNVFIFLMVSAYGMLLSFPFQGYAAVSIFFSTLSIVGTFYFAILILRACAGHKGTSYNFLRAAVFFLMLSSVGPFALGGLMASGKAGTPVYFNSIYFYLHFQYNGWFSFAILAVAYRKLISGEESRTGRYTFLLLFTGCILTLLLSFLWTRPGLVYNILGGTGALLQLAGLGFIMNDTGKKRKYITFNWLEKIAFSAFVLKLLLQLVSAFPLFADFAYLHRNVIIAYLHLVMLGFLTTFIFSAIQRSVKASFNMPVYLFMIAFILSESLLAVEAFVPISSFTTWIFFISCAFPLAAFLIYRRNLIEN